MRKCRENLCLHEIIIRNSDLATLTPPTGRARKNMASVNTGYVNTDQQGQYRRKAAGEKCATLTERIAEGKKEDNIYKNVFENGNKNDLLHL